MTAGATFTFDESLFVEERKISAPGLVYTNNDLKMDLLYNMPQIDNSLQIANKIAHIVTRTFEGRRHETWEPESLSPPSRQLSADNVEYIEDSRGYTATPSSTKLQRSPEGSLKQTRGYDVIHLREMENRKASLHSSVDDLLEGNKRISQGFYSKLLDDTLSELESLGKEREERLADLERKREAQLKAAEEAIKAKPLPEPTTSPPKVEAALDATTKDASEPLEGSRESESGYLPKNIYTEKYDAYTNEYTIIKNKYDNVMNNMIYKPSRIAISKMITTCINAVAGTQRQVDLSFSTISRIINECSDPNLRIYAIFRVVHNVLDMCEPGSQIYLNKKSVWAFAHLIRGLLTIDDSARIIYFSLLLKRCQYVIPRLFIHDDIDTLCQMHEINDLHSDVTFKHIQAFVRLHLSILVVLNDTTLLWSWFAGFLNSCWKRVLKVTLAAVLVAALETCAFYLLATYKKQFEKVLLNCEELLTKELDSPENKRFAPVEMYIGQLRMFFLDFGKSKRLEEPDGYRMKHQEEKLRPQ